MRVRAVNNVLHYNLLNIKMLWNLDSDQLIHHKADDEICGEGAGCYLDHAGATLPMRSMMQMIFSDVMSTQLGNPHSKHFSTSTMICDSRARILSFFDLTHDEYDVIFCVSSIRTMHRIFANLIAIFLLAISVRSDKRIKDRRGIVSIWE